MGDLALILTSIVLGSIGQVVLKIGANKLENISQVAFSIESILKIVWEIFSTPVIIVGLVFFALSFLLWVVVLTKMQLSYAYPMVSLGYIVVSILSYLIFKESFTLNKILGIGIIIIGIFIINR
jgi:multidrug transporter EmrE-like cation transporter